VFNVIVMLCILKIYFSYETALPGPSIQTLHEIALSPVHTTRYIGRSACQPQLCKLCKIGKINHTVFIPVQIMVSPVAALEHHGADVDRQHHVVAVTAEVVDEVLANTQ
jgi:hypothetical protein